MTTMTAASVLIALATTTTTASADTRVLGCKISLDVPAMTRCFQGKIDEAVATTRRDMERKLEDERRDAERRITAIKNSASYIKTPGELVVLEDLRKLQLHGLHDCLAAARDAASLRLAEGRTRLHTDPIGWAGTTIEDLRAAVMADVDAILRDDLARLRRGQAPPNVAAIIDAAWAKFERVGSHHQGMACVVAYLRPHLPALKAQAALAVQAAETKLKQLWEARIRPALHEAIGSAVSAGIGKLAGPDAALLVKAAVAERLLAPARIRDVATKVDALAADPTDPAKLAAVRASIDSRNQGIDAELALEITRVLGHGYIHNDEAPGGGWLIDQGMAAMATLKDLTAESTESVCGLVPEIGAAACAFVVYAVEAALVLGTSPATKTATVAALDKLLDTTIDQALNALRNPGGLPRRPDPANPFAKLLDRATQQLVIAFAEPYVRETYTALAAYDRSVKNLATAASQ